MMESSRTRESNDDCIRLSKQETLVWIK